MSYDFSHLSPQDTKTAMRLVQRIEDITRDIELCSSESSKGILKHFLSLDKAFFSLYTDPKLYNSIKSLERGNSDDATC